jgi:hypothetical protein
MQGFRIEDIPAFFPIIGLQKASVGPCRTQSELQDIAADLGRDFNLDFIQDQRGWQALLMEPSKPNTSRILLPEGLRDAVSLPLRKGRFHGLAPSGTFPSVAPSDFA